jgi:hypothetical protein
MKEKQLYAKKGKWSKYFDTNPFIEFRCCKCGIVHLLQIKVDFKRETFLIRCKIK